VPTFIFRFTRDLRLDDHAGLAIAAGEGEVLPVLVIDRACEERLARSPRRAAFYCAAVAALDASLRERGSKLIVRRGATGATWSASYDGAGGHADARLQSDLEEAGLRALIAHDAPAISPEETADASGASGGGYRAFVPYLATWRDCKPNTYELPLLLRFAASDLQSEHLPIPAEFGAGDRTSDIDPTGGAAGFATFLETDALQYAVAANVPADDRTSHLSAHLSFGTIAARTVVRATLDRIGDPFLLVEERTSLKLFLRALAQRDFFLQLGWFHPITDDAPLQEKMRGFGFARKHAGLDAWRSGRTGYPLVDAGIRQLHATGWMHPHVRAVAASFLCFDLGVDWRVGRDEWDGHLTEDDLALATGNWQWIAGVGADMAQYPRIYNPERQRRQFDPTGDYVRTWVGELANLPAPSRRTIVGQIELPLFSTNEYPQPILDHEKEAHAFLARYRAHLASATKA
jgi:deoxyribodipyrimidine photo-lyase